MSQRSAPSAAASATAEVSEPPRPKVVMRLSGPKPWKPATTATCPSLKRRSISAVLIESMRALPWTPSVLIGICQPSQERALTPRSCKARARRPAVTCSPDATTTSYSRASCRRLVSPTQSTSWLVVPAMAETTTATSWPASTSRLTRRATLLIRSMSRTEVPPNFWTIRAMSSHPGASRARTHRCRSRGANPYSVAVRQSKPRDAWRGGRRNGMNPSPEAAARGPGGTVDPGEIARFAALAEAWWDPRGKFRPLHKLNPLRLQFLRERFLAHFGRDAALLSPFSGLRLLDIGCGGGLVAEPMARLGFAVTGIDAGAAAIAAARRHAEASGLAIDYRFAAAESLAAEGVVFDVVLALEVIEHVADPDAFLAAAGALLRPGGAFIGATINRTARAFVLAILGAEYILGWLPRGTHDWRKFLRPSEFVLGLRRHRLHAVRLAGIAYNPLSGEWSISPDLGVNYIVMATKS